MSTEQDKTLKREDELRDISQIPEVQEGKFAPAKTGFLSKVKEGVSHLGTKLTHKTDEVKEDLQPETIETSSTEQPKTLFGLINSGISGLASNISHTIHSVTGTHEAEKPSEHIEPKTTSTNLLSSVVTHIGGIDSEVKLAQDLEGKSESGPAEKIVEKLSNTIESVKDSQEFVHENTITPNREGPSTLDKINEKYSKVADKISDTFDQVKDKVLPGSDKIEAKTIEREESDVIPESQEEREVLAKLIEAPTHEIAPSELKEFHEIKSGFKETVDEFKHEQRVEELGGKDELVSSNPFDALNREEDLPEEGKRLFGDLSNKTSEEKPTETKSLAQIVKSGLTDAGATLSNTLGQTTDKLISTLETPADKENFRQIA